MHFLPSGEVFSGFFIFTPLCKAPNKKATKVSSLPLRPKDFLILCIILIIPHYWALSNNLLLILLCEAALRCEVRGCCPLKHLGAKNPFNSLKELGPTQTATAIFIDYGLLMIDYWENAMDRRQMTDDGGRKKEGGSN